MIIRGFQEHDIESLKKIHAQFFAQEFSFPDFLRGWMCAFTVEDDDGIITAGGVRNIAELVAITNKSRTVHDRRAALYKILDAACFVAGENGHKDIHAFIQDEKWLKRLTRIGFHKTKGTALVMEL